MVSVPNGLQDGDLCKVRHVSLRLHGQTKGVAEPWAKRHGSSWLQDAAQSRTKKRSEERGKAQHTSDEKERADCLLETDKDREGLLTRTAIDY
jgi:predicted transposase YbfD/YdcC